MARIEPVNPEQTTGKTREMLDQVKQKYGQIPNLIKALANSPAALEAYLSFNQAMAGGNLPAGLREQIALAVSQESGCEYCLAAHTALGKRAGLSEEQTLAARRGEADEQAAGVALKFARKVVKERGWVTDDDVRMLRDAGYTDPAITEIVAVVLLNIFTNYFNHVFDTKVDFPAAPKLEEQPA